MSVDRRLTSLVTSGVIHAPAALAAVMEAFESILKLSGLTEKAFLRVFFMRLTFQGVLGKLYSS